MPRVPTPISAEARINATCQGEVPRGGSFRQRRASGQGCDSASFHPQNTHGVPRNVDELSSLQSSADTSSSRPGSRAPTEPPVTSVAARGSSLTAGRWGRPEAHRRAEARPRMRSTGWTCQECQEWVPDRESYVSHMKKSHGRVSAATGYSAAPVFLGICPVKQAFSNVRNLRRFLVVWAGSVL